MQKRNILLLAISAVCLTAVIVSSVSGISVVYALAVWLAAMSLVEWKAGYSIKELLQMIRKGAGKGFPVGFLMLFVGMLSAIWRISGTIPALLTILVRFMHPYLFAVIVFASTSLITYIMGSCFSVMGTFGVVFMAMARAGGVNLFLIAGAIMSGTYFGDRSSPIAPCLNLTARLTQTDVMKNVHNYVRTSVIPWVLSFVIYLMMSLRQPLVLGDQGAFTEMFSGQFNLGLFVLLPAIPLFILPLFRVRSNTVFTISIATAALIALIAQKSTIPELLSCLVFGYKSADPAIQQVLGGGGLLSMVNLALVVIISCAFAGIFEGTGMLEPLQVVLIRMGEKIGHFIASTVTGLLFSATFCSLAIAITMNVQLWRETYKNNGSSDSLLALDIANGPVVLVACIPWVVSFSVPKAILGVGEPMIPYSFYVFLLPICWALTRRYYIRKLFPKGN